MKYYDMPFCHGEMGPCLDEENEWKSCFTCEFWYSDGTDLLKEKENKNAEVRRFHKGTARQDR